MPRQRLTNSGLSSRTAAPNETSGMNPNVPIHLYDTHPNARFPIGCEVTFLDDKWLKVRGIVLGHIAEDRLLVQLPTSIEQLDVEDVIAFHETKEKIGEKPVDPLVASRGNRRARLITFEDLKPYMRDESGGEGDSLEYIPDEPDFIDGDPVGDEHFGELPGDQDPREKIDDDPHTDGSCDVLEIIESVPEDGDVTQLVEDRLREGSKKQALFGFGKKQEYASPVLRNLMGQVDENGNWVYASEADAALKYNLFNDPEVRDLLVQHGMGDADINTYAKIRQHQLKQARMKAERGLTKNQYGIKPQPNYYWGQHTGINYNIKRPGGVPAPKNPRGGNPPQAPPGGAPGGAPGGSPSPSPQPVPSMGGAAQPYTDYIDEIPENELWKMQRESSSHVDQLRHQANLVGGLLGMPKTAAVITEAADVIEAVRELDNGSDLDRMTKKALKNASRGLLDATDHLSRVNNRIARMAASKIEQLYASSLS